MKRIFSVRLNLDDMSASLEFLEGDAALADWLRGFRHGVRGATSRWDAGPGADGYRMGADALKEAQEFQLAKSEGGKKSVESRKAKSGSAQPHRTGSEHGSNTARTQLEDTSVKNENSSNQTLIVNRSIYNRESEQPNNQPVRDEMDLMAPMDQTPAPNSSKWPCERDKEWARELIANGCKIGPNNWTSWERLVADYGQSLTVSCAKSVPAVDRFPDKTEMALIASRGQVNPGDAINPARLHRMEL